MGGYVSYDLVVGEEVRLPLDDDVLHTSHIVGLPGVEAKEPRPGVASEVQLAVGVGGAHAGDSNAGLGEDLVDGESDDILGLHCMDLMPLKNSM